MDANASAIQGMKETYVKYVPTPPNLENKLVGPRDMTVDLPIDMSEERGEQIITQLFDLLPHIATSK